MKIPVKHSQNKKGAWIKGIMIGVIFIDTSTYAIVIGADSKIVEIAIEKVEIIDTTFN